MNIQGEIQRKGVFLKRKITQQEVLVIVGIEMQLWQKDKKNLNPTSDKRTALI